MKQHSNEAALAKEVALSDETAETEVELLVDTVEISSCLRWGLDDKFSGAIVWRTPSRGIMANTVKKRDKLIKLNNVNVSDYSKKQFFNLALSLHNSGQKKFKITVLRSNTKHTRNKNYTSNNDSNNSNDNIDDDDNDIYFDDSDSSDGDSSQSSDNNGENDEKSLNVSKLMRIEANTNKMYHIGNKQRKIFTSAIITGLSEISNVHQSFRATVVLDFEWQPLEEDVLHGIQLMKEGGPKLYAKEFKPMWAPKWAFRNAIEIHS